MRARARLARYAAPVAFLLAATIAILLIRSGLENGSATAPVRPATTAATTTPAPTETAPGTTAPPTTTEPAGEEEFYEIQADDTLAVVAEQFGTTVEQLLVLNPELDPVALTIGDRIRVK
ncbi:MAG: LysM peptidoglycan-binding domain-containing protein [Actinomycetota bacterium]|nr:LysM peptidoglycan-binding domain-containing protein [Actinomycetota bacterium]